MAKKSQKSQLQAQLKSKLKAQPPRLVYHKEDLEAIIAFSLLPQGTREAADIALKALGEMTSMELEMAERISAADHEACVYQIASIAIDESYDDEHSRTSAAQWLAHNVVYESRCSRIGADLRMIGILLGQVFFKKNRR